MSSFADRLVSRSAGLALPSDAALLRPRPMARFEAVSAAPEAEAGLDTVSEAVPAPKRPEAGGAAALTRGTSVSPLRAPIGEEIPRDFSVPPARPAAEMEALPGEPDDNLYADQSRHMEGPVQPRRKPPETVGRMDLAYVTTEHTVPTAAGGVIEHTDPVNPEPSQPVSAIPAPLSPDRVPFVVARPFRAPVPPADRPASKTAMPPVVSIGRIDVQFLPQDQPKPAPRPEPRRSQGFDAYTRARRGEPR